MKLDDVQAARVREWIDQGLKVAEIQNRLAEEMGIRLTYMEARFLLDDLKLRPKDLQPAAVPTPVLSGPGTGPGKVAGPGAGPGAGGRMDAPGPVAGPGGASPLKAVPMENDGTAPGGISVQVDEIARPGLVVSGKVTFSDGETAEWGIDQMGRPMLMPKNKGYRPSQADIMAFQDELGQVLGRLGY